MPRAWAEPRLSAMVEAIRHESFYVTGTWIDDSLGVYVGWAARENSFSDGMLIRNERDDIVLVFAGEDYPNQAPQPASKRVDMGAKTKGPRI